MKKWILLAAMAASSTAFGANVKFKNQVVCSESWGVKSLMTTLEQKANELAETTKADEVSVKISSVSSWGVGNGALCAVVSFKTKEAKSEDKEEKAKDADTSNTDEERNEFEKEPY